MTVSSQRYQGSIVCPPCASICHVSHHTHTHTHHVTPCVLQGSSSNIIELSMNTAPPINMPSQASPSPQPGLYLLVAALLASLK